MATLKRPGRRRFFQLASALSLVALMAGHSSLSAAEVAQAIGEREVGIASFYSKKLYGQAMADGTPLDPESNVAAHRTLPLGSWARVTNLANHRSEIVQIRDRGPFIKGRIIDVTPRTAKKLGMYRKGIARVAVAPIAPPAQASDSATANSTP